MDFLLLPYLDFLCLFWYFCSGSYVMHFTWEIFRLEQVKMLLCKELPLLTLQFPWLPNFYSTPRERSYLMKLYFSRLFCQADFKRMENCRIQNRQASTGTQQHIQKWWTAFQILQEEEGRSLFHRRGNFVKSSSRFVYLFI